MFIAHGPLGFLITRAARRFDRWRAVPVGVGVAGAIAPDLDLLWFYTFGARRHLHHSYWPHLPWVWVAGGLAGWALLGAIRPRWRPAWEIFVGTVLLAHLVPDTLVGGIRWLAPLADDWIRLVVILPQYNFWVWNFVLHWTFLTELAICGVAMVAWWRARGGRAGAALR